MKKAILFLFYIFFVPLMGAPIDELDTFIETTREKWNVPGIAVSVVKDGKEIFKKGYGVLDVETQEKVSEDTFFQLASVTKTFTAAGLGVLADQGKLLWDENVINHLPEFALKEPYPTRYTTLRDLLAHRTGLPAFGGDLLGKLGFSNQEILRRARFIEPASSFRDKAHYSNMGYFIAGELMGRVLGTSWEQAIDATLLRPLEMKRTGFPDLLDSKNVARGHVFKEGKLQVVGWDRTGGFPAAGALVSTASDMGVWMQMLLNQGNYHGKQVLKPETVQEMFRSSMAGEISFSEVAPINEYSGFDFGLGWGNYHYMGEMIVEKGGGLDGIRTLVTLVPEKKLGITILTNLNLTLFPEAVRAEFLELYLGRSGQDFQEQIMAEDKQLQKLIQPQPLPKNPLPPSRPLQDFIETFESPLYGRFVLFLKEGELLVDAGPGSLRGTLTHFGRDTFVLNWPVVNTGNDETTFVFGPDGKVIEFETKSLGKFIVDGEKK